MNIHEYQAKALLHDYGAPVADGYVATTPQEAVSAAGKLKPLVDRVYDFAELPKAKEAMEADAHVGKIVVRVG